MKSKKIVAAILATTLLSSVLAGCSKTNSNSATTGEADKDQFLSVAMVAEPKTLDASIGTDLYSSQILQEVMEGLTRVESENGKDVVKPAGAEKWEVSPDGLTWTFKLRDNQWSDGQKVTADQYEYAIKRTLNPETGAPYAFLLFPIKNAVEYNSEKAKVEDLGVKALDEKTLEFKLAAPTPYFLDLTYFKVFQPQRKDLVEKHGDKYGTEMETMLFNGPFVMKEWVHGSKVELEKNDKYWDKDSVKLGKVTMKIITDENARMSELSNGSIDYAGVTKPEWVKKFDDTKNFEVLKSNDPSASYFFFNHNFKLFSNANVRKAFSLAVTREDQVKTLYRGIGDPAYGWAPPSLQIGGEDFRQKANYEPIKDLQKENPDPKALLIKGLQELGMDPDPAKVSVTFLNSGTTARDKEFADYYQQMFQKALGITLKVESMEWAAFSKRTEDMDFELAAAGWTGDYNDPMTMFDMWVTGAGVVPTGWSNAKYDALIKKAGATADQKERFEAFKEAEKILLYEEAAIAPTVYRKKNTYVYKYAKGLMSTLFGSGIEFKYAYTQGRP